MAIIEAIWSLAYAICGMIVAVVLLCLEEGEE